MTEIHKYKGKISKYIEAWDGNKCTNEKLCGIV